MMDKPDQQDQNRKLQDAICGIITEDLYRLIVSKPFAKGDWTKVVVRPVMIKNKLHFQETRYVGTKVLHENYEKAEITENLVKYLQEDFGQLEAECIERKLMILTNKKGTVTVKEKKKTENTDMAAGKNIGTGMDGVCGVSKEHNRAKNYILKDGEPVDFLVALGVQTADGRVVKAKYHKFKQINRYLEFIEDILPAIEQEETVRIVDFGCGKSYLTFALYYYLKIKHNKNVEIIGLDLKKDVIETCTRLKEKLGYSGLRFLQGDIKNYENTDQIDVVVSLHACDTATDYAIAKAVSWEAKVIMAVPCCQHEVNKQLSFSRQDKCAPLQDIMKYGIIKERMAALITDAYRANCLEEAGYETQILEFIDLEHTPKNLLIRAVKKTGSGKENLKMKSKAQALMEATSMKGSFKEESSIEKSSIEEYLHIQPLLGQLLDKNDGMRS